MSLRDSEIPPPKDNANIDKLLILHMQSLKRAYISTEVNKVGLEEIK